LSPHGRAAYVQQALAASAPNVLSRLPARCRPSPYRRTVPLKPSGRPRRVHDARRHGAS
jgi:hypothetical protein